MIVINIVSFSLLASVSLFFNGVVLPRVALILGAIITPFNFCLSRIWINKLRGPSIARKERKILVIGGAGYIGSAVVKLFLNNNIKVRILDIMMFGDKAIEDVKNSENLEIIEGDLRKISDVAKAMKGATDVIHLGGLVGDPACAIDEKLTIDINLMSTNMIIQLAKTNNINKFIFASTCSVYGESDEVLNENSNLNPLSLYAKSKIASENVLLNSSDNEFHPIIIRFGTIYGLSGRIRFDLVVNLLTAKAYKDKCYNIIRRGSMEAVCSCS